MAITRLNLEDFLNLHEGGPVLDVRSPSEFIHAHIPGAVSFPLFTDDERKIIGTTYKQVSRQKAIKIGLEAFGKNLITMVEKAEELARDFQPQKSCVRVHCWRGGMRSAAVAWLLDLYGFKVYLLNGGYKAYRTWVLKQFGKRYSLKIVGGCTGGNKTGLLQLMSARGEKVIDLEAIAGHKGSAFGNLNLDAQPGQEQFENVLASQLSWYNSSVPEKPIWLEGESQRLGSVNIPQPFFIQMRESDLYFMDIPFENRLQHIVEGYGGYDKEKLINAIVRIKKRLGGLETKSAVNFLIEDDVESCFAILLKYYDKHYLKSTNSNEFKDRKIIYIQSNTTNPENNLTKLLSYV